MEYLENLELTFNKLLTDLKDDLSTIRTNRPTPKLIEDIEAVYLGTSMPIKPLGTISVEPPRNLVVTPWDKEAINSVSKAIEDAKLGFSSSVMGAVVRVALPQLTDERRKELDRIVRNIAEQNRIKMRVVRDEVNKRVNQETDQDTKFRNKEKLQKLVDAFNEKLDESVESKLTEISQ